MILKMYNYKNSDAEVPDSASLKEEYGKGKGESIPACPLLPTTGGGDAEKDGVAGKQQGGIGGEWQGEVGLLGVGLQVVACIVREAKAEDARACGRGGEAVLHKTEGVPLVLRLDKQYHIQVTSSSPEALHLHRVGLHSVGKGLGLHRRRGGDSLHRVDFDASLHTFVARDSTVNGVRCDAVGLDFGGVDNADPLAAVRQQVGEEACLVGAHISKLAQQRGIGVAVVLAGARSEACREAQQAYQ